LLLLLLSLMVLQDGNVEHALVLRWSKRKDEQTGCQAAWTLCEKLSNRIK